MERKTSTSYATILRLLNQGKTLQVVVTNLNYPDDRSYDRMRILSGRKSMYMFIDDIRTSFMRSCFTKNILNYKRPKTSEQLVQNMLRYDINQRLKITDVRVV